MYVIKTLSMVNYLIENGFDIKKVDRNVYDRTKLIFLFEDTFGLRQCMNKFNT